MSKQLDGIEPKDIIKTVTGRVTTLWPSKTFNGKFGEKQIQNGSIEVDGKSYGLKFENQEFDTNYKGKMVTLTSTRGKHGLNGVVMDHESYDKKDGTHVDQDVIRVTKTGRVEWEGVESAKPAPKQSQQKPVVETIVNDKKDVQAELDRLVENHMYIDALVRTAYAKRGYDAETLRSYVSSIYIEANKKGLAFHKQESVQPVEPEVDPEDWGSVVVPNGHPKFMELGGKKLAEIGKPALTRLHQYFLENPSDKPFAKAVEQAAEDLQLGGAEELEQDDIPW